MRRRLVLVVLVLVTLPVAASAGIIFGKKGAKPSPQERVPELIRIVQTDGDENKRAGACEELRDYDPAQFPDIVPALVEALLNDKKAGVRAEAAHSLGKIRPVSQMAGRALEKALADDSSMRVRVQARSALLSYHWAGYHSAGKKEEPLVKSKEPPLADPPAAPQGGPVPPILPARLTPVPEGPGLPPVNPPRDPVPAQLPQGPAMEPPPPAKPASPQGPALD
jgi:hypothetical protein